MFVITTLSIVNPWTIWEGAAFAQGIRGLSIGALSKLTAKPKGNYYSVAFEVQMPMSMATRKSASAHIRFSNKALLKQLDDVALKQMNIFMKRGSNGIGRMDLGRSPHKWVWHHHPDRVGVMQLVPKWQHSNSSSIFWKTMHPTGSGGMSLWGRGYGRSPF